MSIVLYVILATSTVTSPRPFDQNEPTCVVRQLDSMSGEKKPFKLSDAVDPCRQLYNWTDDEAQLALSVTRALVMMRNKRREATEAGVDLNAVDQIFDHIGNQERSTFGWEGDPRPVPESLTEIANRLPESMTDAQRLRAGLVILFAAVAHNSINAFIEHRIKSRQ